MPPGSWLYSYTSCQRSSAVEQRFRNGEPGSHRAAGDSAAGLRGSKYPTAGIKTLAVNSVSARAAYPAALNLAGNRCWYQTGYRVDWSGHKNQTITQWLLLVAGRLTEVKGGGKRRTLTWTGLPVKGNVPGGLRDDVEQARDDSQKTRRYLSIK